MIRNIKQYADANNDGNHWYSFIQKTSLPSVGAGRWADLSMGAGVPRFNAYVGGQIEATPFLGSGNNGVYAGSYNSSKTKYLHKIQATTTAANSVPYHLMVCDYLMFYPLVDLDSTDLQEFDNTQTLPRYADGLGVQLMIVVTTPMTTTAQFTMNYIDSDNVAKTITSSYVTSSVTGGIASGTSTNGAVSSNSPFVPLANGSKGIKQITGVTNLSSAGGFAAFVLVKPLAQLTLLELGVPNEVTNLQQMARIPEIQEGAYINYIGLQGGSAAPAPIQSLIEFVNV